MRNVLVLGSETDPGVTAVLRELTGDGHPAAFVRQSHRRMA